MGLSSAMIAGVDGLTANAAALAATSDNIANANTVGYKLNDTQFSDMVNTSLVNDYDAGGVQTISHQYVSQQGALQSATSATDLAVSGSGMFVTTQAPSSPSSGSALMFTRAGAFTTNNQGYLQNAQGLYLQGWPANSSGVIDTNSNSASSLQPINVTALAAAPSATTSVTINANLESTITASQAAKDAGTAATDAYSPSSTSTSMAAYTASEGATGTAPDYSMQVTVADSQGSPQTLQIDLLKSNTPNQWYAEVVAVPAGSVQSGAGLVPGQVATGTIAFTSTGALDPKNSTLFGTGSSSITIGGSSTAPGADAANWATNLGVSSQTIAFDMSTTGAGLTQNSGASAVQSVTTNGTAAGSVTSVQINAQGVVSAVFSNGQTRNIAQVALATFPNADGLTAVNGDAYQASNASGTYTLDTPGTGGAGSISPSTLEASTVDLSTEFTNLITTQQAYTASSKVITTADAMVQSLIALIT